MKTYNLFFILLLSFIINAQLKAQTPTTAYDFNMNDCNGKMHHLFGELDSGNVVIMEFFMLSCSPCIVAGHSLDAMVTPLKKKYGEKVRFYQIGFTKSYTCTQIQNWVNTNGFANSVPFDSGDVQVAYYGGMGMPTIAVVGGEKHDVLFTSMDFKPNTDTATISAAIHTFFNPSGIHSNASLTSSVSIYPNPTSGSLILSMNVEKSGTLSLFLSDVEGRKVIDLPLETIKAGAWNKTLALPPLKDGIYFLNGFIDGNSFTKKITIQN